MMVQFRNVLMMAYRTDDYETMDKVQNFVILKKAGADLNVLGQYSLKVIITGLFLIRSCVL
jgi:hypothetical protein